MDFLNIDVAAVFSHSYSRDDYDPSYVAIPLAILKIRECFLGLFFDKCITRDYGHRQKQPWTILVPVFRL